MNKIRILAPHEVQKIAAGEVVERPANVVKELAENALDAGATHLQLHINNGGRDLIRIIDNGCGMSGEDARLSILPHATSKITSVDDLQTINSFGFRGEALASICSVSTCTLRTKQSNDTVGTQLIINVGTITEEKPIACADGTDISVAGIFDNVPARKKFLRPPETELRHIMQLFQSLVIAHLHVHFKLFCDNELIANCPAASDLSTRITQLWDHHLSNQLLTIQAHDEAKKIHLAGLVSNHQLQRYNTSHIFFFVNKRWVKNTSLTKALIRGYQNVLPPGKYPAATLFITVDPMLVDVNIHPRKEEVQFFNERSVEQLVQQAVKNQLQQQITATLHVHTPTAEQQPWQPQSSYRPIWPTAEPFPVITPSIQPIPMPASEPPVIQQRTVTTDYRIIGRLDRTYALLEKNNNLVIIDIHAAHERVLFERFKQTQSESVSVPLLFAHIVHLTTDEAKLISEHHELIAQHGIVIDQHAADRIAVRSVPVDLKNSDLSGLMSEIAALLTEHHNNLDHIHHELIARMACKAAVKAGDEMSEQQIHELVSALERTENSLTCPHGRPTMWTITAYELERKFKRLA